jgi:transcriptional regulator with PAS, ATPase and Fis domain
VSGEDRTATDIESGPTARRLCLLVAHDALLTTFPLPAKGSVVVGRSRDADLRIDLPPVSRRHIVLHVGDRLAVEDCGSSNGTRVREQLVPPGTTVPIAPGDAIELGSVLLVIQRVAAAAPRASAPPLIPASGSMRTLERLVSRVAAGEINVLLHGETGVGKEVFAERIHELSPRAKQPLLRLNCAALTESLLESELFGYERGAFTGADQAKPGLLETASGGTVFLDEIGDLPVALQAKLLRVIEERSVLRLGALKPRPLDVRFVAATHKDLESADSTFRRDLYFRLAGVTLVIPPLRERIDEIEPLARRFVREACVRAKRSVLAISDAALASLRAAPWPGNVRELRNVMERAVLLAEDRIDVEHLPAPRAPTPVPVAAGDLRAGVVAFERQKIVEALDQCRGNQTKAAKLLGISRRTLIERMDEFALPRPRKK